MITMAAMARFYRNFSAVVAVVAILLLIFHSGKLFTNDGYQLILIPYPVTTALQLQMWAIPRPTLRRRLPFHSVMKKQQAILRAEKFFRLSSVSRAVIQVIQVIIHLIVTVQRICLQ